MKESTAEEIQVGDIRHAIFRMLLEFLYTDDVSALLADAPPDDIIDLLAVANQFTLDPLKKECEAALQRFIDFDNVCPLFQAASAYNAGRLRSSCFKFMLKHHAKVQDNVLEVLGPQVLEELECMRDSTVMEQS